MTFSADLGNLFGGTGTFAGNSPAATGGNNFSRNIMLAQLLGNFGGAISASSGNIPFGTNRGQVFAQNLQAGTPQVIQAAQFHQQALQKEKSDKALQQAFGLNPAPTMTAGLPPNVNQLGGPAQAGVQTRQPGSVQQAAGPVNQRQGQLAALLASGDPQLRNAAIQQMMQKPAIPKLEKFKQGQDIVSVRTDPRTGQMTEIARSPLSASRPQTNITNKLPSVKGQTKFAEGIARVATGKIGEIETAADAARTVENGLDLFEQAMGAAEGGGLADAKLGLGRVAQSLGVDPETLGIDNVASLEAANAISNRLALAQVEQMKGALSDRELSFLQTQIPRISNTPEGRKKLIGLLRGANVKAQERADFVSDWIVDNPDARGPEFLKALRGFDRKNPFKPKDFQVSKSPSEMSDEDLLKGLGGG